MAETIEGYLTELRTALAGADPALVQDALYDAEEYLRDAVAEGGGTQESIAAAIDAYGAPSEVAAAYITTERTVQAALRPPTKAIADGRAWYMRFLGIVADPAAWGALFYMVLALATGIVYFTIVVTGLSLSLGMSILIIGLPIALLFIAIARAVSFAEGRMVEGLLGTRMPRRPRAAARGARVLERIKMWLTDYRTWTTMLYMLLQLPLGIIYFTAVVTAVSTSLGLMALPLAQEIWDTPIVQAGGYGYYLEPWAFPLVIGAGLLGLFLTLWAAKGVGYLHGMYAKVMLVGPTEQSQAHVPAAPASPGGVSEGGDAL